MAMQSHRASDAPRGPYPLPAHDGKDQVPAQPQHGIEKPGQFLRSEDEVVHPVEHPARRREKGKPVDGLGAVMILLADAQHETFVEVEAPPPDLAEDGMVFAGIQYLHVPVELADGKSPAVGGADRALPVVDQNDLRRLRHGKVVEGTSGMMADEPSGKADSGRVTVSVRSVPQNLLL